MTIKYCDVCGANLSGKQYEAIDSVKLNIRNKVAYPAKLPDNIDMCNECYKKWNDSLIAAESKIFEKFLSDCGLVLREDGKYHIR